MSRQSDSYKPKAKPSVVQRESEGIGVPRKGTTNNVPGGKRPCGGRADDAGKRERMVGKTGPNDPGGPSRATKCDNCDVGCGLVPSGHRVVDLDALYDQIHRRDVLREAWERVRWNRAAAGGDSQSIRDVEQLGIDAFLERLGTELRTGEYRPSLVRRRYIPKADGSKRPLGIPTVRDCVAQMAAKRVLADFLARLVRLPSEASSLNYFRTGNAVRRFIQLDTYAWHRLKALRVNRKGRHLRAGEADRCTRDSFYNLGLNRLRGNRPLSGPTLLATGDRVMRQPKRSRVSRVREIRMHGLERGLPVTVSATSKGRGRKIY